MAMTLRCSTKTPHEFMAFYYQDELRAVRSGHWKMQFAHEDRNAPDPDAIGNEGLRGGVTTARFPTALFDLATDIAESNDVSGEHPEIVARLSRFADRMRVDLGDSITRTKGRFRRAAGDSGEPTSWYEKSFIHTHMSVGFHGANFDWPDARAFRAQVEAVRPDAIQFHGGGGKAASLSREYRFQHVEIVNHAGSWHADYEDAPELFQYRVGPDGSVLGRIKGGQMRKHLCFNSPGIDQRIAPLVYRKVASERIPAQIWIDENIITVNLCWCPHCRRGFKQQHGIDAPEKVDDPGWEAFARFHRDTFVCWQKKIHDAVQEGSPGTLVTFNHCYWLSQPETPPAFVRNLSADIHHNTQGMEVYGRYGSGIRMPFDIMPGLSAKSWAGKDPKTIDQVLTEIAVITANGGRWNIGEFPTGKEHPVAEFLELARRGARFARQRQPWTHHTQSVPLIAVLQSASTHNARVLPENSRGETAEGDYVWSSTGELDFVRANENPGPTRIYFHDNRAVPDEITGTAEALAENHLHFDIINEDVLVQRLKDYRLLIVPEQFRLREDTAQAIRAFVTAGGSLLATGATVRAGLDDVLGVKLKETHRAADRMDLDGCTVPVSTVFRVKPEGADIQSRYQESGWPAVTVHRFGAGQAVYVAADLMGRYEEGSPFSRRPNKNATPPRQWFGHLFQQLLPENPLLVDAPPWVSIYLRTRGDDRLVHLVDRAADWKKNAKAGQPQPVAIDMQCPSEPRSVLLQPGAEGPSWQWRSGRLQVHLSADQIQLHRIVEVLY